MMPHSTARSGPACIASRRRARQRLRATRSSTNVADIADELTAPEQLKIALRQNCGGHNPARFARPSAPIH